MNNYILDACVVGACIMLALIIRERRRAYKRGYDTAVVDCQIKRGQEDRARREHNGQWKKKRAKA